MYGFPVPLAFLQSGSGSSLVGFMPLILIGGIFYFLVIAPNRKRQKALQATVAALKKGDRIIAAGGFYGEVVSVDKTTLVMKIADNVKVKISKSAVSGLQGDPNAEIAR